MVGNSESDSLIELRKQRSEINEARQLKFTEYGIEEQRAKQKENYKIILRAFNLKVGGTP